MSFRVDESMYFLELLGASGALRRLSLQDEPSKNSVLRRRERSFQKNVAFGVDETQLVFFKVAFRADETSTCKDEFLKSSVSRRQNEHLQGQVFQK